MCVQHATEWEWIIYSCIVSRSSCTDGVADWECVSPINVNRRPHFSHSHRCAAVRTEWRIGECSCFIRMLASCSCIVRRHTHPHVRHQIYICRTLPSALSALHRGLGEWIQRMCIEAIIYSSLRRLWFNLVYTFRPNGIGLPFVTVSSLLFYQSFRTCCTHRVMCIVALCTLAIFCLAFSSSSASAFYAFYFHLMHTQLLVIIIIIIIYMAWCSWFAPARASTYFSDWFLLGI